MITLEQETNLLEDVKIFCSLIQRNPLILIEVDKVKTCEIIEEVARKNMSLTDERLKLLTQYLDNCAQFLRLLCEE